MDTLPLIIHFFCLHCRYRFRGIAEAILRARIANSRWRLSRDKIFLLLNTSLRAVRLYALSAPFFQVLKYQERKGERRKKNQRYCAKLTPKLERKTRTAALTSLRALLSARQSAAALSALDVLKLWKGLFYALWMCDRPVPQQGLCTDLADLVRVLPADAVVPWLRGFWATMAREWAGIDVLRLNKFLLLVRRVLGASLAWMRVREDPDETEAGGERRKKRARIASSRQRWHPERVDAIVRLLGEWPFSLEDEVRTEKESRKRKAEDEDGASGEDETSTQYVPVGLKLHVLDIWVDEAEGAGLLADENEDKDAEGIVQRITALVETLERRTASTAVRVRSKQSLLDDRLPWTGGANGSDRGVSQE